MRELIAKMSLLDAMTVVVALECLIEHPEGKGTSFVERAKVILEEFNS